MVLGGGSVNWEVGLSTGIGYRHPITDVLPSIRNAGFQAIEVSTAPHHLGLGHPERLEAARSAIAEQGLRVHSLHAPFGHDVSFTSREQREDAFARLTLAADALQMLGGGLYVVHPGGEDHRWVWEREMRMALSVEGLSRTWEICRTRGLTLVVETALPHLLGGRTDDLAWLLDRIPSEGTGVCVDTSHTSLGGYLFEALERFADRLVHIQASDNHGTNDDHLPPGEGVIDWKRVIATLERIRYRGLFLLEVSGDDDALSRIGRAAASARALGLG
jgi:sugar phosphate isomerase/epimerase